MKEDHFSPDMQEFIVLLAKYKVKYVIVGGKAVIYYGYVRITGDIDFFYESSEENASKLFLALLEFWRGEVPGIKSKDELLGDDSIVQFGRPPNRIDLITSIEAVDFEEAWNNHLEEKIEINNVEYPIYLIGIEQLIKNKASVKRNKDLDDLKYLRKLKR
jgi:predicted nucleotidyltransferase